VCIPLSWCGVPRGVSLFFQRWVPLSFFCVLAPNHEPSGFWAVFFHLQSCRLPPIFFSPVHLCNPPVCCIPPLLRSFSPRLRGSHLWVGLFFWFLLSFFCFLPTSPLLPPVSVCPPHFNSLNETPAGFLVPLLGPDYSHHARRGSPVCHPQL